MRKLAIFSPWPPQHSGIADYTYDLVDGLAGLGAEVTVFTDCPDPVPAPHNGTLRPTDQFPGPGQFDRVIYQMGNSDRFHSSMIVPLGTYGGIVHLHDTVLHHLIHDLTSGRGQVQLYYRMLKHWYGSETMQRVYRWHRTHDEHFALSDGVIDVPFFDPILHFAHGCIVHSEFSRQRVAQRFPNLRCKVVPQTYCEESPVARAQTDTLRVGAFGAITSRTHIDLLLRAAAHAIAQGASMRIEIAGQLNRRGAALQSLARQLEIEQHVTFHGRVANDVFLDLMRSVDLCVALRFPTMGETSGVVSRALQMGLPTIVNDLGWFAELPDFVTRLAPDPAALPEQLGCLLARHACDPLFHQQARQAAVQYAREVADFERVSRRYLTILDRFPTVVCPHRSTVDAA